MNPKPPSTTSITLSMPPEAVQRLKNAVLAGDQQAIEAVILKFGVTEVRFPKPDLGVEVVKIPQKEGK
jgi:hypothetical protein